MAPCSHHLVLVLWVQSCEHGPMSATLFAARLATLLGPAWRRPGPVSRSQALADALRGLVVDGRVAAGTRIPSERDLAVELGVSRGSVSRAYQRLADAGYLVSRRGAGSTLTVPGGAAPAALPDLHDAEGVLDPTTAARPAPDPLLADAAVRAAVALPRHAAGRGYVPAGLPALRAAIARRLTERGLATTPDEVLVTAGAQHALHLVLGLLVGPGDRVLVDAPAYPRTLSAIRGARARAVPVPLDEDGWSIPAWELSARGAAPRLAVTVADFHNPTGLVMGAAEREALALICARAGAVLVCDETSVELALDGPALPPPLGAFDPGGSVITIGTMSKACWGGVRIGWVRATPRTVRELTALRASVDMAGPILEQLLALELLGDWETVLASRRALLKARRAALFTALAEHAPGWAVRRPHGGISAWARLPGPDATRLAAAAAAHGIAISPGAA